jgi:hypothetical protein
MYFNVELDGKNKFMYMIIELDGKNKFYVYDH